MKPLLIAHRCGPDIYSEQSIASARHALSQGADMVEMDVRYTRDGAPVICHDPNTARVFGVDRCCCDMTLREFMALRYAVDGNCSAHSLEDVLRTDIRPLLLHCKISGELLKDLVGRVLAFDAGEACVFGVQRVDDVEIIKSIRPDLKVLAFMPRKQDLGRFLESRAEIIRLFAAGKPLPGKRTAGLYDKVLL